METYIKEKHNGRRQVNSRLIPNTQPQRRTTQITNPRKISEPTYERRFEHVSSQPLSERATLKCTKCGRMGHAAERCFARNFPTASQRKPATKTSQPDRDRGRDNERIRINCTRGRLLSIHMRRGPEGDFRRMLVDTGAGINLMKENKANQISQSKNQTFFMGNEEHSTNKVTPVKILGKSHIFYIVPDTFPLIEDGIIGLPFLSKYNYEITNNILTIDGNSIPFQKHPLEPIEPGKAKIQTVYLEGKPTPIWFCNNGQRIHHISNEISNESNINQINEFTKIIRTQHIEKILVSYLDIFNLETDTLPCTDLTEHCITLKTDKPINIKSYRPPEYGNKKEIEKQINEMLTKNIIEKSDSPYNAPVWVVPKKLDASGQKKWRIVIDFRKLNEQTDRDAYPLPNVDEILDQLGNAKFFSALDLSSGFHQIPMNKDSKKYTAFSTPQGHFHYNRMPFGLKNAPATFQRMMDTALRGLINKHCFVYLDDIIIFGSTIQEHNTNLAMVLQRLRELRLKIQPDKCEFLKPELEYLGHLVTAEGIKPNPKKLEAVKNFKIPKTPTQVKSFLGLSGYYRKFVKNFSKIAKPLTELTKKDKPFSTGQIPNNLVLTL